MPNGTADNAERRRDWESALVNIAVIKEVQLHQTATMGKLDGKLDLLWNDHMRRQGAERVWRWLYTFALAVIGASEIYLHGH